MIVKIYRIAENFGKVFNLVNWRFCGKSLHLLHYAEALAIAKLKIHQCIRMTDLPNLILTKVSCYIVVHHSARQINVYAIS